MATKKKIFIFDTNVILHDSDCIYQFSNNDIVIPITVIEELDTFKAGNNSTHFHAREFIRILDMLFKDELYGKKVKIGKNYGYVSIILQDEVHPNIEQNFNINKNDHRILNTAYKLNEKYQKEGKIVTLISKDVNLRMKAKVMGIRSEDYIKDAITDVSKLYTGHNKFNVNDELINNLYSENEIDSNLISDKYNFEPNEFIILKNKNKSGLGIIDKENNLLKNIKQRDAYKIKPKNVEQTFALNALLNPDIKLVTLTGKAGTGKTLLALSAALECRKEYKQIYMARPIVPLSNKDIGFLPGDVDAKIKPYMQPLFDNLGLIKSQFKENSKRIQTINTMLENNKIEISPLSYIRGRSLVNIYFIIDEAQNLTPLEVKTIVTRAGVNTKLIFTGDIFQIDHPYLNTHSNGLVHLIDKMKNQSIAAHVNLEKGERSELAELASKIL